MEADIAAKAVELGTNTDFSLFSLFFRADIIVKSVMIILILCSVYFVRPAKWKKYFNLINSEKDASRTRAIEIFPYYSSHLSRKKDSNKADAILIASFFFETYKEE